jgi:hypothetical protein
MYLPLGPFKKSYSAVVYEFIVSTVNSMIKPAIMLSNHKSTTHVNFLLTLSNREIFLVVHSTYLIRLFGWVSLNLNDHSYNNYRKNIKYASCKSVNTYICSYWHSLCLEPFLSLCTNSNYFVSNYFQSLVS